MLIHRTTSAVAQSLCDGRRGGARQGVCRDACSGVCRGARRGVCRDGRHHVRHVGHVVQPCVRHGVGRHDRRGGLTHDIHRGGPPHDRHNVRRGCLTHGVGRDVRHAVLRGGPLHGDRRGDLTHDRHAVLRGGPLHADRGGDLTHDRHDVLRGGPTCGVRHAVLHDDRQFRVARHYRRGHRSSSAQNDGEMSARACSLHDGQPPCLGAVQSDACLHLILAEQAQRSTERLQSREHTQNAS